uniref:hypothetical protein n=1 Tax=Longitalea luteola TaxID=2812563 RepID=UPI001A96BA4B
RLHESEAFFIWGGIHIRRLADPGSTPDPATRKRLHESEAFFIWSWIHIRRQPFKCLLFTGAVTEDVGQFHIHIISIPHCWITEFY